MKTIESQKTLNTTKGYDFEYSRLWKKEVHKQLRAEWTANKNYERND